MSVLIILIAASLFVALLFLVAFIWATKKGQFDDSYTPSVRILFEDNQQATCNVANGKTLKSEILKQVQNEVQIDVPKNQKRKI